MDLDGPLDGVALVATGAYLAAVIFHGNAKQLLPLVVDTKGYLELVSAGAILYGLYNTSAGRPIVPALIGGGLLAMIIQIAARNGNIGDKFQKYGQDGDLFALINSLFKP